MAGKKKTGKDKEEKGLPENLFPPVDKPGINPLEVEDFYNVLTNRDIQNGNWGMDFATTATDTTSESTLTEEDLTRALDALRGIRSHEFPKFDVTNSSWALVMALSLIRLLRVRVRERNHTGAALFGNTIDMEMDFPFSRRNRMNTRTSQMVDRHDAYRDKRSVFQQRMAIADRHIHDHFSVIEKWIDIAKNAKENYKVEDLLAIENIEQRMAALRIFGAEKLIEEAGAKLVSKSRRGNELYLIPRERKLFDEDAYYLKYQCVSTGRIYVSGVPNWLFNRQLAARELAVRQGRDMFQPGFGSWWTTPLPQIEEKYLKQYPEKEWADLAMAWKFRLTLEEYKSLPIANEG